jgi:hypothetical protein
MNFWAMHTIIPSDWITIIDEMEDLHSDSLSVSHYHFLWTPKKGSISADRDIANNRDVVKARCRHDL